MPNIPGSFSPEVPFQKPANPIPGPQQAGVPGRIPGTYGNGAANTDPAPAVPFSGQEPFSDEPISTPFGNGTCKGEWGKRGY